MLCDNFSDMAKTTAAMATSSEWRSLQSENNNSPNYGTLVFNGQAMTVRSWD